MTIVLVLVALALLTAAAVGPSRPLRWREDLLRAWIFRRQRRDLRLALPGLIDSIAAGLASGLSLELAFGEAAASQPAPLDRATFRAASALRLGGSIDEAIAVFADHLPETDLASFGIVLGAFARAGGRIGRSLARVARLLRGRLALEDERAALTAQGRASAVVLLSLAPLSAAFFATASADYLPTLFGPGRSLIAAAVVLEISGAAWLWWLIHRSSRDDDLAALIDAVVVGLDAGLTFQQALAALVSRSPRLARLPEARRLLADLTLGRGASAFDRFASVGQGEARVAAIVGTATRFGSPLADLLVTHADALRDRERREAETAARRLPVLMLFPLSLCILPALLVVFLGPPLLSLLS